MTRHCCDRCQGEITTDRTLLRAECAPLRLHKESLDLCPVRADPLLSWLAADQDAVNVPNGAIAKV